MPQLQGRSEDQSWEVSQPERLDLVPCTLVWYKLGFLNLGNIKFIFRFFTGCFFFIPCVMDAFHNYEHQCPNCRFIIGKSTPDERDVERKKGLKVVIGALIGTIICFIVLLYEGESWQSYNHVKTGLFQPIYSSNRAHMKALNIPLNWGYSSLISTQKWLSDRPDIIAVLRRQAQLINLLENSYF